MKFCFHLFILVFVFQIDLFAQQLTARPCELALARVVAPVGTDAWSKLGVTLAETLEYNLRHPNPVYDSSHPLQRFETEWEEVANQLTPSMLRYLRSIGFDWTINRETTEVEIIVPNFRDIGARFKNLNERKSTETGLPVEHFFTPVVVVSHKDNENELKAIELGSKIPENYELVDAGIMSGLHWYKFLANGLFPIVLPSNHSVLQLNSKAPAAQPIIIRRLSATEHDLAHLYYLNYENPEFGYQLKLVAQEIEKLQNKMSQLKLYASAYSTGFLHTKQADRLNQLIHRGVASTNHGVRNLRERLFFGIETLMLIDPKADLSFLGLPRNLQENRNNIQYNRVFSFVESLPVEQKQALFDEIERRFPKLVVRAGGAAADLRYGPSYMTGMNLFGDSDYIVTKTERGLMTHYALAAHSWRAGSKERAQSDPTAYKDMNIHLAGLIVSLYRFQEISAQQWLKDSLLIPLQKLNQQASENIQMLMQADTAELYSRFGDSLIDPRIFRMPNVDRDSPTGRILFDDVLFWSDPEQIEDLFMVGP